jgi:hypothetical protein
MNENKDLKIQHFLNTAINESLAYLKIKITSRNSHKLINSVSLDNEYFELYDLFVEHLNSIKRVLKQRI